MSHSPQAATWVSAVERETNAYRAISEKTNWPNTSSIDLEEETPTLYDSPLVTETYGMKCQVTQMFLDYYVLDFIDKYGKRLSFDELSQVSVWDVTDEEEHVRLPPRRKRTSDIYYLQSSGRYKVFRDKEEFVGVGFPPTATFE
ncbi:hypothetical protein BJ138DRAFT_1102818 [Hygrophoropsis aurantiaca]|uniref:Uncharacterized protein n=1 Tax=Hygrophoropsis aurantiaca TaxID=72124 RepID=A0ACB8A735_9AGAM|nr:hypothetical protein BJ138DRAFT_1102818 [Hygrophoropsis aurantiaca]